MIDHGHDKGLRERASAGGVIGGARKRPSAVVVWTALDVCVDSGGKRPAVVSRRAAVDVCVD
ncbi:MAG: hypothetical protein ACLP50_18070, partial [Solirubrobacteraceae bacterium]